LAIDDVNGNLHQIEKTKKLMLAKYNFYVTGGGASQEDGKKGGKGKKVKGMQSSQDDFLNK